MKKYLNSKEMNDLLFIYHLAAIDKVMSNDKNKDKTITQFVKDAVYNYIKEQEELEKGLYTIKLPISQFSIDELDLMSTSFAYVNQALINRYSTAMLDVDSDFNIRFDEDIEKIIVNINELLMHIARAKKHLISYR